MRRVHGSGGSIRSECVRVCVFNSPPPVDAHVGRSREPGVEDVNAADGVRTQQRFLKGRVVVEPQALPEPVDRINDHYSNGRVLKVVLVF